MINKFYIYAHYTLDTNELFYIGKGCGLRAYRFINRNNIWTNIYNKHGVRVKIITNDLVEDIAYLQEYLGIKEYSPRANICSGGKGGNSEYLKNIWSSLTKEQYTIRCGNISKALTNRVLSNTHRQKLSNILNNPINRQRCVEKLQSKEVKKKLSDSRKIRITTDLEKNRLQNLRLNQLHTNDTKLKMAQSQGSKLFQVFDKNTGNYIGQWLNKSQCARELNLDSSKIIRVLSNKSKQHKGYVFRYLSL